MQHSVFCLIFKHYMGAILCFSGVLLSVVMGHLQYLVDSKKKKTSRKLPSLLHAFGEGALFSFRPNRYTSNL